MADETPLKAYTTKELANLYGISKDTMRRWISRVENLGQHGYYFTVKQVQKIFDHLGKP